MLNWWASHGSKFPAWVGAARIVFSFTPNSAAAERVFSLLKISFPDVRDTLLADIIQSTLMYADAALQRAQVWTRLVTVFDDCGHRSHKRCVRTDYCVLCVCV